MLISKNRIYEDSLPSDNVVKLKASILFQLYNRKIPCEEHSDYIKTELLDFYPREDGCSVVSNTTLDLKFSKEFKFNKLNAETTAEKITAIAEKIVTKTLALTVEQILLS